MIVRVLCLGAMLASVAPSPVLAQPTETPLLLPGKTTLYEKVLTQPGAALLDENLEPSEILPPFEVFYVYDRVREGGEILLMVGTDAKGTLTGFLRESETVPWEHTLVLAFTARAGRDRVLFFKEETDLAAWLGSANLSSMAARARKAADMQGSLLEDSSIISIEPEEFIDFSSPDQFYILPVLDAKRMRLPNRQRVMAVQIASVTRDDGPGRAMMEEKTPEPARTIVDVGALSEFRVSIVFVIDASSSMQPYITRTRSVVSSVLREVTEANLSDGVRVGVIGYRDDPNEVAGIEYLARMFADPNEVADEMEFLEAVDSLQASRVSTRSFDEDAFAGIDHAIRRIDWRDFHGRLLVLITDASARDASSPYSTLGLSAVDMRNDIQGGSKALPTALFVLHLKTPEGARDHARAEAQYTDLSRMDTGQSLYYPVPLGNPPAFRRKVAALARGLVEQIWKIRAAASGRDDEVFYAPPSPPADADDGDERELLESVADIGRAMALAYLGREAGKRAPRMFKAWASDSDFDDPSTKSFSVRVLLSKSQLSDLQETMKKIIDSLDHAQADPNNFFNQLRDAATLMGRDPNLVGQGGVRNLQNAGLMGEYLSGLPYKSRLMSLSEDDWIRMSVGEQQGIIDGANSNVVLYQRFHDDVDRWIPLNKGDFNDDWVYPVPLDALP